MTKRKRPILGRSLRVLGTVVITGACVAYLIWKIDLRRTADVLAHAEPAYLAVPLPHPGNPPQFHSMAWRWRLLLLARGVTGRSAGSSARTSFRTPRARFCRLRSGATRPASTAAHADTREAARRSRARCCSNGPSAAPPHCFSQPSASRSPSDSTTSAPISGSRWHSSPSPSSAASSSSRARHARRSRDSPCSCELRVERLARAVYEGVHAYRQHTGAPRRVRPDGRRPGRPRPRDLARRPKLVGVDLSPRPYYVMGPLLFLVMLVPVHGQRAGGPRSVLRELPRQLGVPARRSLRDRLPLLPRVLPVGARCGDPRAGAIVLATTPALIDRTARKGERQGNEGLTNNHAMIEGQARRGRHPRLQRGEAPAPTLDGIPNFVDRSSSSTTRRRTARSGRRTRRPRMDPRIT